MTNRKFKLAAMSLATAVAVSTVGPSASAVTYYLSDGSVTVDQDNNGAYSYQNKTDGKTENVYVDEDTQDNGQIIIKQAEDTTTDTTTGNTVTVEENVTNENGERDVDIIIDGVNVDTSDTRPRLTPRLKCPQMQIPKKIKPSSRWARVQMLT